MNTNIEYRRFPDMMPGLNAFQSLNLESLNLEYLNRFQLRDNTFRICRAEHEVPRHQHIGPSFQ
jgi:hypothetical protein